MNAVPTSKAPTLADLEASLSAAQRRLLLAQRANSGARTARPLILTQGEAEAIKENRRDIDTAAKHVRECLEEVEFAEAALEAARNRHRGDMSRMRFEQIDKELALLVKEADACEDSGSPKDLAKVRDRRRRVRDELSLAGIDKYFDPHIFGDAEIVHIHELQQWLDSEGVVGRGPGLDTPSQLRASGRASLSLQAANFRNYVLRIARQALGAVEIQAR